MFAASLAYGVSCSKKLSFLEFCCNSCYSMTKAGLRPPSLITRWRALAMSYVLNYSILGTYTFSRHLDMEFWKLISWAASRCSFNPKNDCFNGPAVSVSILSLKSTAWISVERKEAARSIVRCFCCY